MFQRISDKLKDDGSKLGNKGKFLCKLYQAGFLVPDGVILDSDVYFEFLKENKLADKVTALINTLNKENISHISAEIKDLFESAQLSPDIKQHLSKELDLTKTYAVRSSGTKEDLDDYSFAGQYDTFLNVKGIDEICSFVIGCYSSMFSEVCLSYLLNNKIELDSIAMSVVIQEMVDSQYSGICFTINPVTGNDRELSIEIAEGLGDRVVGGQAVPEQYYYNWYEKTVVDKDENKDNKLLSKAMVKEYGETFFKVQLLFGYPCDIEFAVRDGKLYLLQARRITKIRYGALKDIWSTADFKDGGVSATVCTPYMWSLYEYIWEFTLRKFILDSKILSKQETDRKLGDMFYGRCYWNLSVVKLAMSKVIGYKEREFDSEYGIKIMYEGDGDTTKLTLSSLYAITRMFLAQKRILNERNENCEIYKSDLLQKYNSYKEMYDNQSIPDIEKEWYELTKRVYLQSEATYFWQIFINTIHQSLYKDSLLKYVSESEYLTLLGAIDNISHLLPFYDMWEISRLIAGDKNICKFWTENSAEYISNVVLNKANPNLEKYLQENKNSQSFENIMTKVNELINKYGYHSDKELDVTYPCYYEDITPIIISIKEMVSLGDEFSPMSDKEQGEANYKKVLESIQAKVGKKKYKKIYTKIMNMRKMLWWREEYRDISTRFYYIIRIYTIELANHLVKKGILQEISDIWFLKVEMLWQYLEGSQTKEKLQETISKNREYYNAYVNYMSENEIGGNFGTDDDTTISLSEAEIKGIGANSGRVTGTARVIEDFSQISRLQQNDILVTRFTDTGWTSKFAVLSGIVTEYGGILCHAAIVSREYGIPAIVSCHDAMKKIKDGQRITIDGATGCIVIEE